MAQPNFERNRAIIIRKVAGETLRAIHKDYPEITYPTLVEAARRVREKFARELGNGRPIDEISAEWGISEDAIAQMVERAHMSLTELRARDDEREAERLRLFEKQFVTAMENLRAHGYEPTTWEEFERFAAQVEEDEDSDEAVFRVRNLRAAADLEDQMVSDGWVFESALPEGDEAARIVVRFTRP